ncbi:MAG: hypothetical protein LBH59_03970, partial [Planctomycetaceae bacterium]|nr:hypothetical protein [Planctomycetaceae bacterium]
PPFPFVMGLNKCYKNYCKLFFIDKVKNNFHAIINKNKRKTLVLHKTHLHKKQLKVPQINNT